MQDSSSRKPVRIVSTNTIAQQVAPQGGNHGQQQTRHAHPRYDAQGAIENFNQSGLFWVFFFVAVGVGFATWFQVLFVGGFSHLVWLHLAAGFFAFMGWMSISEPGQSWFRLLWAALVRTFVSCFLVLIPMLLQSRIWFFGTIVDQVNGVFGDLTLKALVYILCFLMYFLMPWSWTGYAISEGQRINGAIRFIYYALLFFLSILIFFIIGSVAAQQDTGYAGYSLPNALEMWTQFWDWLVSTGKLAVSGVTGQINQSTQTYYTGQVERQQGLPLGVRISRTFADKPVFYYEKRGDVVEVTADRFASYNGILEARTFADDMPVELSCIYQWGTASRNPAAKSTLPGSCVRERGLDGLYRNTCRWDARPAQLTVRYTGQIADTYDVSCSIPMDQLPYQEDFGTAGTFSIQADFAFQTWGYAELGFMDADTRRVLLNQGLNPAQEMDIPRTVTAIYTPGPVSLGMLETQTQPFGIDVAEPDTNTLPPFGITFNNAWLGRGGVTKIHSLTLQVPEPVTLDTSPSSTYGGCSGIGTTVPIVLGPGSVEPSDDPNLPVQTVPEGYNWYRFEDPTIATGEVSKTIRCPTVVDDWADLLAGDLSPRTFTWVARASYDYQTVTPVPVRLGIEVIE